MANLYVQVGIDAPLFNLFDYHWNEESLGAPPKIGTLVKLEFGKKLTTGIVLRVSKNLSYTERAGKKSNVKDILGLAPIARLDPGIMRLANFAAKYYLRPIGEVLLSTIPNEWKKPQLWEKLTKQIEKQQLKLAGKKNSEVSGQNYELNQEQQQVLKTLLDYSEKKTYKTILLRGVTGSGKTAVYLNWLQEITKGDNAQALILVPEINLTPQLEKTLKKYFLEKDLITLHSNLTPLERNFAWWRLQNGHGKIILGTRLSVLAPIPNLRAIVVDEEHDQSYKQQEGLRYSARDLAIWRAADLKIPILLSSATPSCETWLKVMDHKIPLLKLSHRAKKGATTPKLELIDLKNAKINKQLDKNGLTIQIKQAIEKAWQSGKQSLVFVNRRGFAPVLSCIHCSCKSECKKCSAWMVVHKKSAKQEDRILQCHHCGLVNWLPKICPDCGNQDLQMLGMGTQKIEDVLEELFPQMSLLRVDSDTSKNKGQAENLFAKIHSGQAQLIVGTQMLTKGHDFEQVEIVIVLDADKSLYSHDFRAIEKMFSQLVQVAGRGGRGEGSEQAKIYIQTQFPEHPLFWAIATDRHEEFLTSLVNERKLSKLPPYSYQAMIIAESRSFEKNVEVLQQIKKEVMSCHNQFTPVLLYDAVPRGIQKLAGQERAQMLLESADRQALQIALEHCLGVIEKVKKKSRAIKIIIDRDPIQF